VLKRIIKEKIEYAIKINDQMGDPCEICMDNSEFSKDSFREKQKNWLKQLEEIKTD